MNVITGGLVDHPDLAVQIGDLIGVMGHVYEGMLDMNSGTSVLPKTRIS